MNTLVQDYRKLIDRHYSAVQADTRLDALENSDKFFKVEKASKQFWNDFNELERDFIAKLEKVNG